MLVFVLSRGVVYGTIEAIASAWEKRFNVRIDSVISGRSIPVVHLLWEQTDWVRFPAPRQVIIQETWVYQN